MSTVHQASTINYVTHDRGYQDKVMLVLFGSGCNTYRLLKKLVYIASTVNKGNVLTECCDWKELHIRVKHVQSVYDKRSTDVEEVLKNAITFWSYVNYMLQQTISVLDILVPPEGRVMPLCDMLVEMLTITANRVEILQLHGVLKDNNIILLEACRNIKSVLNCIVA